jgi:DNA-binding ferritin-like protein (Dps family)
MTQIKVKSIEEAVLKIDKLDEDSLEKLSEAHVLAQETFVGYILSSAIEYKNDDLLDLLIYYFNIFAEAAVIQGVKLKKITDDDIEEFQEEYVQTLDEYMETEDNDLIASLCNQPNLLSFLLSEISMEDEEGEKLEDETGTYLFIVGVAMIALLNRAIQK